MDKIESYLYLFRSLIKDRTTQEGFTPDEYRELIKRVEAWCRAELKGAKDGVCKAGKGN